jgi:hypothetical protein
VEIFRKDVCGKAHKGGDDEKMKRFLVSMNSFGLLSHHAEQAPSIGEQYSMHSGKRRKRKVK